MAAHYGSKTDFIQWTQQIQLEKRKYSQLPKRRVFKLPDEVSMNTQHFNYIKLRKENVNPTLIYSSFLQGTSTEPRLPHSKSLHTIHIT